MERILFDIRHLTRIRAWVNPSPDFPSSFLFLRPRPIQPQGHLGTFQKQGDRLGKGGGNHFTGQVSVRQSASSVSANPIAKKINIGLVLLIHLTSNGFQWRLPVPSAGCQYSAGSQRRCCAAAAAGPALYCSRCSYRSPWRRTSESCEY